MTRRILRDRGNTRAPIVIPQGPTDRLLSVRQPILPMMPGDVDFWFERDVDSNLAPTETQTPTTYQMVRTGDPVPTGRSVTYVTTYVEKATAYRRDLSIVWHVYLVVPSDTSTETPTTPETPTTQPPVASVCTCLNLLGVVTLNVNCPVHGTAAQVRT